MYYSAIKVLGNGHFLYAVMPQSRTIPKFFHSLPGLGLIIIQTFAFIKKNSTF